MRIKKSLYSIVAILLSMLIAFFASSQANIQILTSDEVTRLSGSFFVLVEQDEPLTLEQARAKRGEFRWGGKENPNYGLSDKGVWLTVKFTHFTDNRDWVIDLDFSQLDSVDFYLTAENKILTQAQQGKLNSNQQYRIPVLAAKIPPGKPVELYIRIQSDSSSLIAPVSVRSEERHSKSMLIDSILWGLFYGGLIILAIYNLVLYFSVRETSILAYVGFISTVLIWQFVWGGHVHLLISSAIAPWLIQHTPLIFIAIGVSSGIFSITFLNTRANAPKTHMLVILMVYMQVLLGVTSLFSIISPIWLNSAVYTLGILAICSYVAAGFESYNNNFQPARYFMLAWGTLAIGAVVGILSLFGVIPSNRFAAYCFQVGVFFEAGLFSLALMDKSRSQLEMEVEQASTDLRNNMELIEEQNARLDIARKDAIKASNVKSQFLANMSHEIRTPLNAILGFSRELSSASLPAEKQEQVRIINAAADSLLTIVNDVLDFSKIEAGKLTLNNQPFSPNQVFEDMVSLMAKSAHQKQLEFIYELEPLPEKLIGDAFRIKQILSNLLGNALKFTSTGHIAFSASGKNLPHGLYEMNLKVEDTGIGISRQDRKKLFSAFSQVDEALNRNYQGTGLGLVISQELIKLMHGQLALTSVSGQGSCFSISLKMNQLTNRYYLSPSTEWRDKKVVIYDPLPMARQTSARLLSYLGASVTSVESIQFLNTVQSSNQKFDYLFASIPQSKLDTRNDVLGFLLEFKAGKRVLLYSGSDPFNHYPSLSQHFNVQLRMPLTPNKIEGLLKAPQFVEKNPLQSRLLNLPEVRVLAVDDMDMNLKLISTWLRDTPVDLTLCNTGADAVAKCQSEEFDLILMDVQMPNMDGLQATQKIRKTPLNLGTPIVAVTAHAFKEEQERLMASGMDDYLPKPIELSQLVETINRWCIQYDREELELLSWDWSLAVRRANGNEAVAKEMMESFIEQLQPSIDAIESAWTDLNLEDLLHHVHRIHGACCYTGAVKFQSLCNEIEDALKRKQQTLVESKIPKLIAESRCVMIEAKAKT